ncbi:MAG TPA: hypothetical protein VES96_08870 [Nitrospiraceae bacterium]|nr:hypothetical protein [Nitrospiraceae bacterium]
MKKDKTDFPKRHSNRQSAKSRRRVSAGAAQGADDGLTCSEAQVEALLSEGEST